MRKVYASGCICTKRHPLGRHGIQHVLQMEQEKGMALGPEDDHKHFNDFGKGHLHSPRE